MNISPTFAPEARWHRIGQQGRAVGQFAITPPGWSERRKTLADIEYDATLTAEAEPFVSTWWKRKPSLWAGEWPSDVAVVQLLGTEDWGAFRDQGGQHGWHPPLADDRFFGALSDAGLTAGWSAKPIDVRDRAWKPRSSYHGVFVESRAPWKCPNEEAWIALTEDDRFSAWVVVPDDFNGRAELLWHDNGVFASPPASAALRAARLPSVRLEPLLYVGELEAAMPGSVLDHPTGP